MNNLVEKNILIFRIFTLVSYLFINSLFIIKYSHQYEILFAFIYILFFTFLSIYYNTIKLKDRFYKILFILLGSLFFIFTVYINYKVDGYSLQVDRWSALENSVKALLNNQYPYDFLSHMQHKSSNLPGLMVIALPFYLLLGSVAYMQSFFYLVFIYLIFKLFRDYKERFFALLLVLLSPSYLWENYTKSDMLSNFILLALFIYWFKNRYIENSKLSFVLLAIFTAFIFLTRTSTVLIIILNLFYTFYHFTIKRKFYFLIIFMIISFILLFLGFHRAENFDKIIISNPFFIQSTRQPILLSLCFIFLAFILSFKVKSNFDVFLASGNLMFLMFFISIIISFYNFGFQNVIENSYFDISYFNMSLPFIIPSLVYLFLEKKSIEK